MTIDSTVVAGIVVPSRDPVFLGIVSIHIVVAIVAVTAGIVAMLSAKTGRRHRLAGLTYYRALIGVFLTMAALVIVRWRQDYHLFIIGAVAFVAAIVGRRSIRRQGRRRYRTHILGMGASYVLLLVAFYVDNGRNLPLWRALPPAMYWLLPVMIGIPLIARAYRQNRLATAERVRQA